MPRAPLLLLVLAGWTGCRTAVELPPPAGDLALVEGLLLADSTSSLFRVRLGPSVGQDPPVAAPPDQVTLSLSGPGGAPAPLAPVPDSAGFFRAALPILRGARYRLAGRIAGLAVQAETVVPLGFEVAAPADPIRLERGGFGLAPYAWTAPGATAFYGLGTRFRATLRIDTRATADTLMIDEPAEAVPVSSFTVIAINADAHQYLFGPSPRSNVTGGFGFLGGGIAIGRRVTWE